MAKKRKVFVVVTEETRQMYAGDRLIPSLMAGDRHFTCSEVTQEGGLLNMKLSITPGKKELHYTLSIPIFHVLYIVSGADMKQLGFDDAVVDGRRGVE